MEKNDVKFVAGQKKKKIADKIRTRLTPAIQKRLRHLQRRRRGCRSCQRHVAAQQEKLPKAATSPDRQPRRVKRLPSGSSRCLQRDAAGSRCLHPSLAAICRGIQPPPPFCFSLFVPFFLSASVVLTLKQSRNQEQKERGKPLCIHANGTYLL